MTDEQEKAKRQAYSFNFPPDKKEKFAALARSMNRPMAWLLLEAIDRMIESGGTYPTNTAPPQTSIGNDDVLKAYVSKADMSQILSEYVQKDSWDDLRADVADLRELVNEVPAQIEELRAQITATGVSDSVSPTKKTTIKKPPAQGSQSTVQEAEIQKWVNRLNANPGLKAAIKDGLDQGLTGKGLCEQLFTKGFGANENTKPFDSSVTARMRGAIEYLNSIKNGDETNV